MTDNKIKTMQRSFTLSIATIILLTIISCTSSKRTAFLVIPEATTHIENHIDTDAYLEKYKEYDGAYLEIETNIEHTGSKEDMGIFGKWDYSRVNRRKYIVVNPEADYLTSFRLGYKPDNLFMRVIYPNGKVSDFGIADLRKEKSTYGGTIYTFIYPNITKGCVIEEGFDISYAAKYYPQLYFDIPLQYRIPCENLEFTFSCPNWWELAVKQLGENISLDYEYINDFENNKLFLIYNQADVPALKWEPFSPQFKKTARYMEFMVTELKMAGASYSAESNWDDLIDEFYKRFLKKSDKTKINFDTKEYNLPERKYKTLASLTSSLVYGAANNLERVDSILSFIRENIEYSYSNKNSNFGDILKNKAGDNYDITSLANAMFDEATIKSEYLLVHSAEDGYFDMGFITPRQIYVPALKVTVDTSTYVVFPYLEDLPMNHTPYLFQGETAIIIQKDGYFSTYEIPSGNNTSNQANEKFDIEITEDGIVNVDETITYSGKFAYEQRRDLKELDEDETKEYINSLVTYKEDGFVLDSFEIINQDSIRTNLEIKLYYKLKDMVAIVGNEVIMQTSELFEPVNKSDFGISSTNRLNPIVIYYKSDLSKIITIRFPENWSVQSELINFQTENIFGQLTTNYSSNDNELHSEIIISLNPIEKPKTKYPELLEIINNQSSLLPTSLVFNINPM